MSGESCFRQLEEGSEIWVELEEATQNLFQRGVVDEDTMRRLLQEVDFELHSAAGDVYDFCGDFSDQRVDEEFLRSSISTLRNKNKVALEKMIRLCEPYSPFSCTISSSRIQQEDSHHATSNS